MILKIFLLFLPFLALVKSQSVPITTLDQMLWDTNAVMQSKEVKLSNLLSSSADDVGALITGPAPALSTAANSYKNTLKDFSSISNFDLSKTSSSCADINMKISSIKFDLQKLLGLSRQATQNLTTITSKMNYVAYYYSLNYGILTGTQVGNYISVLSAYYSIASEYNFYVYFLGVAYNNETYVLSNLNAFKSVYCSCGIKTKEDSTLESNLDYIQRPLEKDQTRTRAALLAASSAVNLAISQIPVTPRTASVAGNLQFLSDFLAKTSTLSDYTKINAGRKTSCDEWQKRRTLVLSLYYEYQKISTQIYSNWTTLNGYLAAVNVTVGVLNLTLNAVQGNALQSACNSMGYASSLFNGYFNDIKHAMTMISSVLAEITSVGDSFCACTEKVTTSMVTSTTVEQTTSTTIPSTSTTSRTSTTIPTTSTTIPSTSTTSTTIPSTSTTSTTIPTTSTTIPTTSTTSTTIPTTSTTIPTTSTTSTTIPTTSTTEQTTSTTSTTIPTTSTTIPTTSTTSTTIPTTSTTIPTTSSTSTTIPSTSTTMPTTSTTIPSTSTTSTTIPSTSTTISTTSTTEQTTSTTSTTIPTTSTTEQTTSTTSTTIPTTSTTEQTTSTTSTTIPTTSTTISTTSTTEQTTSTTSTTIPTTSTTEQTTSTTSTTIPTTSTTEQTTSTTSTTIPTTSTTIPSTSTTSTTMPTTIPATTTEQITTTTRGRGRRTTTLAPPIVTTTMPPLVLTTTTVPLPPPPGLTLPVLTTTTLAPPVVTTTTIQTTTTKRRGKPIG